MTPVTVRASGLTGRPAVRSRSSTWLCRAGGHRPVPAVSSGGAPSTSPIWYAQNESGRAAVIAGSFCRSDPAAELRGLTNAFVPAATARSL